MHPTGIRITREAYEALRRTLVRDCRVGHHMHDGGMPLERAASLPLWPWLADPPRPPPPGRRCWRVSASWTTAYWSVCRLPSPHWPALIQGALPASECGPSQTFASHVPPVFLKSNQHVHECYHTLDRGLILRMVAMATIPTPGPSLAPSAWQGPGWRAEAQRCMPHAGVHKITPESLTAMYQRSATQSAYTFASVSKSMGMEQDNYLGCVCPLLPPQKSHTQPQASGNLAPHIGAVECAHFMMHTCSLPPKCCPHS
jgi:hypothetical protein